MKNSLTHIFLLLCTFSLFTWSAQAQNNAIHVTSVDNAHEHVPGRTCHAHTNLQNQIQADPMLEERMRGMEEKTQRYMQEHRGSYGRAVREIPVYVHVIYRTNQENISQAQIESQIDQLNADFAASNSDYNPPADFAGVAAGNTDIVFKLISVSRKSSSRTSWGTNDDMKNASQGGVPAVTPSTHLNMWVCNIGGGILGYAQFPGAGAASTDGVVMSPQYFGSNNYGSGYYLSAPFDRGRTTTHEVGHYLNLRHIWGDGGCNRDDGVSDTPIAGRSNGGCPSATQNTCAGGQRDMHMNYMDYTDDACMYMFSAGQKSRMLTCLATTRSSLGSDVGGGGNGGGSNCVASPSLRIRTDRYGSETTWEVRNSNNQVVKSGNNYANNRTYNINLNLSAGSYTFTIFDSYGDGICCSYGNGSYALTSGGNTLGSGGAFGSSDVTTFCVGSGNRAAARTTAEVVDANEVNLYPNPANNTINVDLSGVTANFTGRIIDATGRTVWVGALEAGQNAINIATLPAGLYHMAVAKTDGTVITKKFVKK
ncbi:MAG: M43 family zinc metalloprotease [Aureispira sp.]